MKNNFSEKRLHRIKQRGERQKQIFELQQEYNQYYPSKNGMRVSNLVLIVVIIAILLYTAAAFYLQFTTGLEISSTLTALWYTFWTTEVLVLGGIKISKVITDYKKKKAEELLEEEMDEEVFE
jgi:uncharacterized membrane protein